MTRWESDASVAHLNLDRRALKRRGPENLNDRAPGSARETERRWRVGQDPTLTRSDENVGAPVRCRVLRNITAVVVAVAGLTALSIVSYTTISQVDQFRSQKAVVDSRLAGSLFDCLENQVHHLVPAGAEVWIDPVGTDVSAGPGLSPITDPLRVVVATYANLTPVKKGHIVLSLVETGGTTSCSGFSIEHAPD